MTLSEIKTSLVRHIARRLQSWAELLFSTVEAHKEQDAQTKASSEIDAPLDSGNESGGPPDDWARRVTKGPPAHWLDRVRAARPDFLATDVEAQSQLARPDDQAAEASMPDANEEEPRRAAGDSVRPKPLPLRPQAESSRPFPPANNRSKVSLLDETYLESTERPDIESHVVAEEQRTTPRHDPLMPEADNELDKALTESSPPGSSLKPRLNDEYGRGHLTVANNDEQSSPSQENSYAKPDPGPIRKASGEEAHPSYEIRSPDRIPSRFQPLPMVESITNLPKPGTPLSNALSSFAHHEAVSDRSASSEETAQGTFDSIRSLPFRVLPGTETSDPVSETPSESAYSKVTYVNRTYPEILRLETAKPGIDQISAVNKLDKSERLDERWPQLPESRSDSNLEEASRVIREMERLRRLDLEQKGLLWSE